MSVTSAPATPTKKKFTFPTAFTILFILLILIAAATYLIPAGSYDYNADGEPIPGTYHAVPQNPQKLLSSALKGPINGMYGIQDETRQRRLLELRRVVRRDRRRPVRPDHRRLPRRHDEDRRHQRRDRLGRQQAEGQREVDVPHPDDDLCHRRNLLRDGRGDAGLLRAHHHGDARGRLRCAERGRRSSCWAPASA